MRSTETSCLFAFALLAAGPALFASSEGARPNLLLLLADDLRWDCLGFAGDPVVRTPNIDRLASRGVVFRNSFVTTPICAVSRAVTLTGQYALRNGVHDFTTQFPDLTRGALSTCGRQKAISYQYQ